MTATKSPASTDPSSGPTISVASLPSNAPAASGVSPSTIHVTYVFPAGAGVELLEHEHGPSVAADDEATLPGLERNRLRAGVDENGRRFLLLLERQPGVVEIAREPSRPHADREREDGCDGCDRREGRRRAAPARLERDHGLRLRLCGGDDAVPKRGPRDGPGGRDREGLRRLPEGLEVLLAALAALEVLLVGAALLGVERVEGVARGQFVNSGFHDPSSEDSSRSSRSRARPANIRLLTVPSGTPSRSASSDWE